MIPLSSMKQSNDIVITSGQSPPFVIMNAENHLFQGFLLNDRSRDSGFMMAIDFTVGSAAS
jgi:hypothetical protein